MIFKNVKDWKKVEADLREMGFTRQNLLVVRELWYRLQIENVVKEMTEAELEQALEQVAEAYELI